MTYHLNYEVYLFYLTPLVTVLFQIKNIVFYSTVEHLNNWTNLTLSLFLILDISVLFVIHWPNKI